MKRSLVSIAAAVAGVFCVQAQAQQHYGFYGGVSLSRLDVTPDGSTSYAPTAVTLVAGNQVNRLVAVELRVGGGLSGDSADGQKVKLKDSVGGYLKLFAPLSHNASLYGLLGYTSGKVESTPLAGGAATRYSENNASFGVGGSFSINRLNFVTVEWARLFAGRDVTVNALSAGYGLRF